MKHDVGAEGCGDDFYTTNKATQVVWSNIKCCARCTATRQPLKTGNEAVQLVCHLTPADHAYICRRLADLVGSRGPVMGRGSS